MIYDIDNTIDINPYTNCRVELHGLDMTRDVTGPSSKELLGQADMTVGRVGDDSCMCIIYNEGCSSSSGRRLAGDVIKVNDSMQNHQGAKMIAKLIKSEELVQAIDDRMFTLQNSMDRIVGRLDMEVLKPKKPKSKKPKAVKDDGNLFNRKLGETGVGDDGDEIKLTIETMKGKLDSVEKEIEITSIAMNEEVKGMKEEVKGMKDKVSKMEGKVDKIEKSMEELKDMLSKLLVMGGGGAAV